MAGCPSPCSARYPPGATPGQAPAIGFVSLGTRTDTLFANAGLDVCNGVQLRVTDGGSLVFGPKAPLDAPRHTVSVGSREWVVQLAQDIHPSHVGSWTVLASGLVLVALLALLAVRTLRYESQLEQLTTAQERDVERTASVARLARVLSATRGADNVEAVVRREAGQPFEASEVALAVDGADDGSGARPAAGDGTRGPLSDARETGRPVVVEDAADLAARYADPPAGFETPRLESILAIPLPELTEGTVHGALAFGWTEPQELNLADLDVASTVAELVAGALARARSIDQVRTKAALEEQRAEIATALMDATTVERVARRTLAVLSRQLEVAWGYVAVGDTTREGLVVRRHPARPARAPGLGRPHVRSPPARRDVVEARCRAPAAERRRADRAVRGAGDPRWAVPGRRRCWVETPRRRGRAGWARSPTSSPKPSSGPACSTGRPRPRRPCRTPC